MPSKSSTDLFSTDLKKLQTPKIPCSLHFGTFYSMLVQFWNCGVIKQKQR